MARITWKGEGASPPPSLEWRGVTFPLGQAVEVDDIQIIAKAKTASMFKVEDDPPKPAPTPSPPPPPVPSPDEDGDDDDDDDKPTARAVHHPPPVHPRAGVGRGQAVPRKKK